jgi:phosphatidylinositol alpha-1,6-mannosyltransferase
VYPYGIIAWIATRLVPRPLFISGIGTYSVAPLLRNWTAWLARTACMSAYRVVAISRYTAQRMREVVPNARIDVVTPGLESVPAMQARQHVTHTILSVGALKKRKGYHIAIQAFAEAKKSIPTLTYTIVGDQRDTVYFETLRQLARQYSVESALIFRQHLSEEVLHAEYQNAGVFLLPSVNVGNHFEGFGLVFLEAAAQGLPVIGTTGNGIADAVGEGNGILVEQNDVSSLARAIVAVLNDEQQYAAMSASSLAWAKQHPASHMVQAYEKIYAEALNRHA